MCEGNWIQVLSRSGIPMRLHVLCGAVGRLHISCTLSFILWPAPLS